MGAARSVRGAVVILGLVSCGRIGYDPAVDQSAIGGAGAVARMDGALVGGRREDGAAGLGTDGPGSSPRDAASMPGAEAGSPTDATAPGSRDGVPPPTDAPIVQTPDATSGLVSFNAPTRIPALVGSDNDGNPSATADLLELYFGSDRRRGGQGDIWMSSRSSPTAPWAAPRMVTELSSDFIDETPEVAPDGLRMWLAIEKSRTGRDIYVSTRPNRSALWSIPILVPELSSDLNDHAPTPSWSLLRMVMHSDRPGTQGRFDILEAVRSSPTATWSTPMAVTELNTTVYEGAPHLSPDDLTIYFDSNRPGGLGGWDIYMAVRPSVSAPFGTPMLIRGVSSADNEGSPWVSADGRYIVFSTTRDRNSQIYEAKR